MAPKWCSYLRYGDRVSKELDLRRRFPCERRWGFANYVTDLQPGADWP